VSVVVLALTLASVRRELAPGSCASSFHPVASVQLSAEDLFPRSLYAAGIASFPGHECHCSPVAVAHSRVVVVVVVNVVVFVVLCSHTLQLHSR